MRKLVRAVLVLSVALVLAGCGGGASSGSSNGGGGGVSLPSGFPSDFPVYSGASVSAASSQSGKFDVAWTSGGKGGALFGWYQSHLGSGDWTVQGVAGDATNGGLIDFNRKSNSSFGGTIRLADGRIHVIMGPGCPCSPPS